MPICTVRIFKCIYGQPIWANFFMLPFVQSVSCAEHFFEISAIVSLVDVASVVPTHFHLKQTQHTPCAQGGHQHTPATLDGDVAVERD